MNFKELADRAAELSNAEVGPPTIFDIAGYSHYEDITCNVLAFLLDPRKAHGLKGLAAKAMISAVDPKHNFVEEDLESAEVRQEQSFHWKSIDLVLESKSYALVIEVKVLAGLHADQLAWYEQYASEVLKQDQSRKFLILLAPAAKLVKPPPDSKFKKLTFEAFQESLQRMGWLEKCNPRYRNLFEDWIANATKFRKSRTLTSEARYFLVNNWMAIEEMRGQKQEEASYKKNLEAMQNGLRTEFENLLRTAASYGLNQTKAGFFAGEGSKLLLRHEETNQLGLVRYFPKRVRDRGFHVECYVSTTGWQVSICIPGKNPSPHDEILRLLNAYRLSPKDPGGCQCWSAASVLIKEWSCQTMSANGNAIDLDQLNDYAEEVGAELENVMGRLHSASL